MKRARFFFWCAVYWPLEQLSRVGWAIDRAAQWAALKSLDAEDALRGTDEPWEAA